MQNGDIKNVFLHVACYSRYPHALHVLLYQPNLVVNHSQVRQEDINEDCS